MDKPESEKLTPDPKEAERLLAGMLSNDGVPSRWVPPKIETLREEFPGFEITRLLGRGSMGAVYQGRHLELDRDVAIKVLPPELGEDPEFTERFRREARTMAKLDHPGITRVFDFGQTGGCLFYIVMEFCEEQDLGRWIKSGNLTSRLALQAIIQICEALEYAHQAGCVHRDIKPGNIFLRADGQIKIGDFGLAKLTTNTTLPDYGLTASGVGMGTPAYMAPEQLTDDENGIDPRTDLYALGVTLYEMLTGRIPRGNFAPPSERSDVDPQIDPIVLRAIHEEPQARYCTPSNPVGPTRR